MYLCPSNVLTHRNVFPVLEEGFKETEAEVLLEDIVFVTGKLGTGLFMILILVALLRIVFDSSVKGFVRSHTYFIT